MWGLYMWGLLEIQKEMICFFAALTGFALPDSETLCYRYD